jgi:cytidylate kinase
MAIVTLSHQLGAGGGQIARAVAQGLHYRCIGPEVLAAAAERHGLAQEQLTRLGEAKPAFLDRLGSETQVYLAVMQSAIHDAALEDNVVLLGRGGQWLLRGIPHVLRVRVIAPFEMRVRRLAEVAESTGRDAVSDFLRRDDADRAGRMRYLYDQDIDDPRLYDLVISTANGDLEGAAAIIVLLARRPALQTTGAGKRLLADRALASRVRVTLMMDERTRRHRHLRVDAEAGIVHVATTAPSAHVEAVVRTLPEVTGVRVDEIPRLSALLAA